MKKDTILKKIILLMTIIYAVFSLTSCSFITINRGQKEKENTPSESEKLTESLWPEGIGRAEDNYELWKAEAKARVSSLNYRAFEKNTFTVAVAPGFTFNPSSPSNNYEDALLERNAMVEEKYSIDLMQIETPADLMISEAYSAYLAGVYYADLMMIPAKELGAFAEKGFLLNVHSLPYIDYNKSYFDTRAMNQAAAGYNAYAVMGDMTRDIGSYYCLYVNTALFEKLGLEVPYSAVEDGSWTWDMLLTLTRQAATVDGGVLNIGAGTSSELVSVVMKSADQDYLKTGLGVTPQIAYGTEATVKAVDLLRGMQYSYKILFDQYSNTGSSLGDFRMGNLMFFAGKVSQMAEVAKMGGGWSVLPVPKFDVAAETYTTFLSPDAPVIVISASTPNPEDVASALTALNAASGKYLIEAYYDDLTVNAVNNSRTLDMLDYVCGVKGGRALTDFVYMFGTQYPELGQSTYGALWDHICNGSGTVAEAAQSAHYILNWRMQNAFPVK